MPSSGHRPCYSDIKYELIKIHPLASTAAPLVAGSVNLKRLFHCAFPAEKEENPLNHYTTLRHLRLESRPLFPSVGREDLFAFRRPRLRRRRRRRTTGRKLCLFCLPPLLVLLFPRRRKVVEEEEAGNNKMWRRRRRRR